MDRRFWEAPTPKRRNKLEFSTPVAGFKRLKEELDSDDASQSDTRMSPSRFCDCERKTKKAKTERKSESQLLADLQRTPEQTSSALRVKEKSFQEEEAESEFLWLANIPRTPRQDSSKRCSPISGKVSARPLASTTNQHVTFRPTAKCCAFIPDTSLRLDKSSAMKSDENFTAQAHELLSPRCDLTWHTVDAATSLNALQEHRINPLQNHNLQTQDSPSRQHLHSTLSENIAPSDIHYNFGTPERHFNYGLRVPGASVVNPSTGEGNSPDDDYFPYPPPSPGTWLEYLLSSPAQAPEDELSYVHMTAPEARTAPPLLTCDPNCLPYDKFKDLAEKASDSDCKNNHILDIDFDTPTKSEYTFLHVGIADIPDNILFSANHPLIMALNGVILSGTPTLETRSRVAAFKAAFDQVHTSLQHIADAIGQPRLFGNCGDYDDVRYTTVALGNLLSDEKYRQVLNHLATLARLELEMSNFGQGRGYFVDPDEAGGTNPEGLFMQRCKWNFNQRAIVPVRTPSDISYSGSVERAFATGDWDEVSDDEETPAGFGFERFHGDERSTHADEDTDEPLAVWDDVMDESLERVVNENRFTRDGEGFDEVLAGMDED